MRRRDGDGCQSDAAIGKASASAVRENMSDIRCSYARVAGKDAVGAPLGDEKNSAEGGIGAGGGKRCKNCASFLSFGSALASISL